MDLIFRKNKSRSCCSISVPPPERSPKPKSPNFLTKFTKDNIARNLSLGSDKEEIKHRSMDVAKVLRRKVVSKSVADPTNLADDEVGTSGKKTKKKLRGLITSVYHEKSKKSLDTSISLPTSSGPVFGVSLEEAVKRSRVNDNLPLCRVFQDCIMFIETFGIQREGIYRVPGYRAKLQELKSLYNRGEPVKLTNYDPETIAMLLKLYLRELPEPLLTRKLGMEFERVLQTQSESESINLLCNMLRQLPEANYATLAWLCIHINHICRYSDVNKMTITNLIIILSPTLSISNTLLRVLCENADRMFPGILLDPNKSIPTYEVDSSLIALREELIQSYVWAKARNDALMYVKSKLKEQVREERKLIKEFENEVKDMKDRNESKLTGEVKLRQGRTRSCNNRIINENNEEDLRVYLDMLEKENSQLEAGKISIYNSLIDDTMSSIEAYTEIRFRRTFSKRQSEE